MGSNRSCDEYDSARQAYFDIRSASTAGFVAGGALVGAAIVMALVWPESHAVATRNVFPVANVSDKAGYFGLAGRF